MPGKCNEYYDNKTFLPGLQSREEFHSESHLVEENKSRTIPLTRSLVVFGLVISLVGVAVACLILTSICLSILRQVHERVETLELRLEYLERNQELEADKHADPLFSRLHSSMDGSSQNLRIKRNINRSARDRNRSLRKKTPTPLVSIHMEMATNHQRRKRNPSTENSNKVVWKVSDWVPQKSRENFKIADKELADIGVKHKGLYFIYSQVVFRNFGMNNILSIRADDREITRCYDGVDHIEDSSEKFKTCYTGTVALIRANENITVHNLYGHDIHGESISNFFGLIKLSDIP